jgi:apolipoprotein N-acyltransferase
MSMYPTTHRLASGPAALLTAAWPLGLALAAGALAVLGFAPFSLYPLPVLAVAALIESLRHGGPRTGFWRGYAFGIGLMGLGVPWIRISLNEFGNLDAWIANVMMVVFVAVMALYYGLTGWLARRLDAGGPWALPLLLVPAILVILEWLRGWLFTGFPWLNLGNSQIDGPLAGLAPVLGVYGISLAVAVSGGLLWGLVRWPGMARLGAAAGLVVLWLSGFALQQADWTRPSAPPLTAVVVQANIPQAMKWEPEARVEIMEAHLDMTLPHLGSADLVLWPETAIPDFLHLVRAQLTEPLAGRARAAGTEIVIGIPVLDLDTRRYYNGLVSITSGEDTYAKRHLVPFGEFMPFKGLIGPLAELFEVPMSDFSAGEDARPLLDVGPHQAGAAICYEDAFPAEVMEALPEAAYLITVSNDAWFGDSLAPHQHLEIARMRALESGRDMVRATNTGISAIVDHRGRLTGTIPSFQRGTLAGEITPRAGITPYARLGNVLALGLAAMMLAAAVLIGRRRAG